MLKQFPCKIVETAIAQPGKHGHSKIHFIGLDIFTGKKHEEICPAKDTIEVICFVVLYFMLLILLELLFTYAIVVVFYVALSGVALHSYL